MDRKKLKKMGVIWIRLMVLSGLLLNSTMVFAGHGPDPVSEKDQVKILSLLEQKTGNPQLMEKAREKLLSLDERQIRLIASLSERITNEQSMGADFAYLLMAALLTLS